MRIAWKIATAYALRHPARLLWTSLAMIAASCVVVWVVSGYDALLARSDDQAFEYLGRYDFFVVPDGADEDVRIPNDFVEAMGADQDVAELDLALQAKIQWQPDKKIDVRALMSTKGGPGGPGAGGRGARGGGPGRPGQPGNAPNGPPGPNAKQPTKDQPRGGRGGGPSGSRRRMFFGMPDLVGISGTTSPYPLVEGRWIEQGDASLREAVVGNSVVAQYGVGIGDDLLAIHGTKEYRLTIVGVVEQSREAPRRAQQSETGRPMGMGTSLGPATSAVYVPLPLARKILGEEDGEANLVCVKLREGADADAFHTRWAPKTSRSITPILLVGVEDLTAAMQQGFSAGRMKQQAWTATGMATAAALFIIFTTLSMGVHERVRQLAVLRAVGLTRRQVGGVIAVEGVLLGLIGWGGGLLAGWGLLTFLDGAKPDLFSGGVSLGGACVLLTGVSALGGALLASLLPAWQAMSVQPLEAMSPRRSIVPGLRWILPVGLLGLLLIGVNPFLVHVMPIDGATRYAAYALIGCTSMAAGFLLLTPLFIIASEAVFGPWIARLMRLDPRLLRQQLTSNLWRTFGTTAALSVGLGLYVSMMTWGYSMLEPFKVGDWSPDMLAYFQQGGLPDSEIAAVREIPGVSSDQFAPLAVEQPRLASDITDSRRGQSVARQDNVIMIGLAPDALTGDRPLLDLDFVRGSRDEAVERLQQGRACIVPDHFLDATGLDIGDRFAVLPPHAPDRPVEYEIAAAVDLPGWHWMTKFCGFRKRSGRSAAMIFAKYEDVRADFDLQQTNFIWMNRDPNTPVDEIGPNIQEIADRNLGMEQPVNAQGKWDFAVQTFGPSLRVTTPEQLNERILSRSDSMIWMMCQLPLITLLVTSLGVVNTVFASVRTRRWELGVMRSIGVTRSALFRMILAEGLLIALVACVLSLAFGVLAGWCGIGISRYVSFFGGLATPLVVPWSKLLFGFGITLTLCLLAALWPAIATGRAEPLTLLREGRSAT